jgi:hypothetical protein
MRLVRQERLISKPAKLVNGKVIPEKVKLGKISKTIKIG